jgi:colanic acid/amylovoran biosynthesis protein
MRILLTGLVTVHWGRAEYGNIGNYYIVATTVRELHRVFPHAEISTTFQMTNEFAKRERIKVLPMSLYYTWSETDLLRSMEELGLATIFKTTGNLFETTPYIEEVLKNDLVIDFSGEMWGDHAEPVGKKRFLVNLIKLRIAQLLGKKTALLAGSQGPFNKCPEIDFARLVFENFDIISNRESTSKELLKTNGFDITNVQNFTDPAFLFDPASDEDIAEIYAREKIFDEERKTIGFILCGFNMLEGPYDKEPRRDDEFTQFAEVVEYIINKLDARVVLMSHQNGFELEPEFELINGRDYPYAKQLQNVVNKRGLVDDNNLICIDRPYLPDETKAIIGQFDMFITGRIHGFVAATSQFVPTVVITRGHGGVSHRNIGFARSVGLDEYISNPADSQDMIQKISSCWDNMEKIKETLKIRIPIVQETARACFDSLKTI